MTYKVTLPNGVDTSEYMKQVQEFAESDFSDLVDLQKAILRLS
jgi:hypothetical protein